jgi:hypothetical protein
MEMNRSSDPSNDPVVLRIVDTALAEFMKDGMVTSARCDVCGSLIEISWLGTRRSAVSIRCSCGKFHGIFRGMLN